MGLRQGEWSQGQVEDPMSSPLTSPRQHVYRGGLYTQGTVVVRPLLPLRTVRARGSCWPWPLGPGCPTVLLPGFPKRLLKANMR